MKKSLWKKITAIALSVMVLTLAGCSKKEPVQEENKPANENVEVVHPIRSAYTGQSYYIDDAENWEDAMKDLGFTGMKVIYQEKNGYVVTADSDGLFEEMVNTYVIYESNDSIFIETASVDSILEKYEVCDINGDPVGKEVVLYFDYMGNGGAGFHEAQVWNFEYRTPNFLFSSNADFGYSSALVDNYGVVIDNIYTGYQTKIDYKEHVIGDNIFDSNGSPVCSWFLNFDPAYETIIEDVDNDGRDELICKEYSFLDSHVDYIGSTVTTIDYDPDLQVFVIADTEFVEPTNGELV